MDRIRAHELALTERFLAGLAELDPAGERLPVAGRREISGRTGVVSIQTAFADPAQVADALDTDYGIMTRVGLHAPVRPSDVGDVPHGDDPVFLWMVEYGSRSGAGVGGAA